MVYQKEAGRLEDNKLPLAVGSSNVMSKLDCWGAMEQKTGLRNQVVFLPCNFTIEGVRKIVLSNAESECTIRPRHCLVDHSQNPASWIGQRRRFIGLHSKTGQPSAESAVRGDRKRPGAKDALKFDRNELSQNG
jgi:hypothetical protein